MEIKKLLVGDKKKGFSSWLNEFGIPRDFAKGLVKAIEKPAEMPFIISNIVRDFDKLKIKSKMELRNGLIRIQLAASIFNHSDPILMEKQNYIAEALEKLLFGDNLLLREEILEGEIFKEVKKRSKVK
jgi:hypothetical protein